MNTNIEGIFVDYIEATGVQTIYISNYNYTSSTRMVIDYYQASNKTSDAIYYFANNIKFNCDDGNIVDYDSEVGNIKFMKKDIRSIIDFTIKGKLLYNGNLIHDYSDSSTAWSGTGNVQLFTNSTSKYNRSGTQRLYSFKLYEGEELIYDLRPFVKSDGTTGLLDLISDTFYSNVVVEGLEDQPFITGGNVDNLYLFANHNNGQAENNGSYRLYDMKIEGDSEGVESGVNYVDYLIGDGASWINTNTVVATGYKISIDYRVINNSSDGVFYGVGMSKGFSYDSSYGTTVGLLYSSIKIRDNGSGYANTYYKSVSITLEKDCNLTRTLVKVSNPKSLYLFANNNIGNSQKAEGIANSNIFIGKFKIFDTSDNLVLDLRPCLDTQGVPCMYDEVSKTYLYNQGTGTFGYKKTLRDFQPVLDSNNVPCLLDKIKNKFYYDKNGNLFNTKEKVDGYRKLDYIEGDGSNYLDLGVWTIDNNTRIELDCDVISQGSSNMIFITGGNPLYSFRHGENTYFYLQNSNTNVELWRGGDTRIKAIITSDEFIHNETSINLLDLGYPSEYSFNNRNLYLFKKLLAGLSFEQNCRIYYFKIYQSDELVFDGIPVLDQDNVPCLYDKVTDIFFYNQGTGEFSYGIEELDAPQVDYVEYLKSDLNSYIDTGKKFDNTWTRIESKYKCVMGWADKLFTSNRFLMRMNYGGGLFQYKDENNVDKAIGTAGYNELGVDKKSWVDLNIVWTPNNVTVNNITKTYEGVAQSSKDNILLLECSSYYIYYWKVYDANNQLIQDLRPCLGKDGTACMYDTVSKQYFYNQGTGQFAYGERIGYTPIEYIESTGTQYIDTGVVPTANTDIDMTCRECDYSDYISNGLILNLDGINNTRRGHKSDTTVWEDLSGNGIDFDLHNVTINDDNMYFAGDKTSTDVYSYASIQNVEDWVNLHDDSKNYTVEICMKMDTGGDLYQPIISAKPSGIDVGMSAGGLVFNNTSNGFSKEGHTHGGVLSSFTVSYDMSNIIAYDNTIQQEITTTNANGAYKPNLDAPTTNAFWIGIRLTGGVYAYKGYIYSIRIYDRQLTDEERLYNHSVDVKKFGVLTEVQTCSVGKHILNGLQIINAYYKYGKTDTTIQPNLVASEGATLTMGSTNLALLDESDIETAINNGWSLV